MMVRPRSVKNYLDSASVFIMLDSGAMASYVVFYLAGLYPVPATRQFLLSSPFFRQISFFNPLFNSTTTIIARGFQGNPPDGTGGKVFVKVRAKSFLR